MEISGFVVVRRPEANFDSEGKGIWPRTAPRIADTYYGGVWRMPWHDIETAKYHGLLPQTLRDEYESKVCDDTGTSVAICLKSDLARRLLEYSNRLEERCELIAVSSLTLSSVKGLISIDQSHVEHRGWDPFQIGGDSLLYEGLFAAPEKFPAWQAKLNRHGLLGSLEDATAYISEYMILARKGEIEEPLALNDSPIEPIEIFSVGIGK